ncbi:MAG: endonuclease [bacterium]|nr:endonuclease [bacterium]
MPGYDPDFLGVHLPIPGSSPSLSGDLVSNSSLREEVYADYANYTVVTNAARRSPVVVALNIDQNKLRKTKRRSRWLIDSRIGSDFQLNNDYYRHNRWDRGHLARKASASWGENIRLAQTASDETFYYSNACLQHENFNQDEWLELEDWVLGLKLDKNGRIASFSGPIMEGFMRTVEPEGRPPAQAPAGFFKVVCFINKETDKLDVRAFIMLQDRDAIADKSGREVFNFQTYQVSVSEIEDKTGLAFQDEIYQQNPLYYRENDEARSNYNISHFPERVEVDSPTEIISEGARRVFVADDEVEVYLAAAMVNPEGKETTNEWVSIINLEPKDVNIGGWKLLDKENRELTLQPRVLAPGEAVAIKPLSPVRLSNKGGTIILHNEQGERIDRIKYTKQEAKVEGRPMIFAYRYTSD